LTSFFHIGAIHELLLQDLWNFHGTASCVNEQDFAEYFAGRDRGYGIQIVRCVPMVKSLPLDELRSKFGFTAPQSWAYASPGLVSSIGA
jgi:predicted transcriptional regulator